MEFSEADIERMRYELEHPEAIQERIERENEADKFIKTTQERFKIEGRDFWKEFEEWKRINGK
jgi:hypothetical protein